MPSLRAVEDDKRRESSLFSNSIVSESSLLARYFLCDALHDTDVSRFSHCFPTLWELLLPLILICSTWLLQEFMLFYCLISSKPSSASMPALTNTPFSLW